MYFCGFIKGLSCSAQKNSLELRELAIVVLPSSRSMDAHPTHVFGPDSTDIVAYSDVLKHSQSRAGLSLDSVFCDGLHLWSCDPALGFSDDAGHGATSKANQAHGHGKKHAFATLNSHHATPVHMRGHTKVSSRPHFAIDNLQGDAVCLQEANDIEEANVAEDSAQDVTGARAKGAVDRFPFDDGP